MVVTACHMSRSSRACGFLCTGDSITQYFHERWLVSSHALCVSSACTFCFRHLLLESTGAGHHWNRLLLLMHLETRLVIAPLSDGSAMLMRHPPHTFCGSKSLALFQWKIPCTSRSGREALHLV